MTALETTEHDDPDRGTARASVQRTGVVRVPLPLPEALRLFTPEGERRWVEGWDPTYPAGGRPPTAAGLVFEVGKEAGSSTWIVTRFDPDGGEAAYAYVLPGHRAVLVEVAVTEHGEGSLATVRYHMTSLGPEGDAFVREFAATYDAFLREWEHDIRTHLTSTAPRSR